MRHLALVAALLLGLASLASAQETSTQAVAVAYETNQILRLNGRTVATGTVYSGTITYRAPTDWEVAHQVAPQTTIGGVAAIYTFTRTAVVAVRSLAWSDEATTDATIWAASDAALDAAFPGVLRFHADGSAAGP